MDNDEYKRILEEQERRIEVAQLNITGLSAAQKAAGHKSSGVFRLFGSVIELDTPNELLPIKSTEFEGWRFRVYLAINRFASKYQLLSRLPKAARRILRIESVDYDGLIEHEFGTDVSFRNADSLFYLFRRTSFLSNRSASLHFLLDDDTEIGPFKNVESFLEGARRGVKIKGYLVNESCVK